MNVTSGINPEELVSGASGARGLRLGEVLGSPAGGANAVDAPPSGGFAASLRKAVESVVAPQQDAARAVQDFAEGGNGELHKTMLTMERADITMKFFVSLRNKALEAYREVMHMGS